MRHLAACLNEPASKRWRRVYLAIHVVEHLLQRGSPELVSETLNGHHFDLVQRMSFLENFMYPEDGRVQTLIRRKASAARVAFNTLQKAEAEAEICSRSSMCESSTCNKNMKKTGGIVRPWHCDDTTDDESGGEECNGPKMRIARPKLPLEDELITDSDSTNSGSAPASTCANQFAVPDLFGEQVDVVDLLSEVSEVTTIADQSVMHGSIRGEVAVPDARRDCSFKPWCLQRLGKPFGPLA